MYDESEKTCPHTNKQLLSFVGLIINKNIN